MVTLVVFKKIFLIFTENSLYEMVLNLLVSAESHFLIYIVTFHLESIDYCYKELQFSKFVSAETHRYSLINLCEKSKFIFIRH